MVAQTIDETSQYIERAADQYVRIPINLQTAREVSDIAC
jgi:hypothetical protein